MRDAMTNLERLIEAHVEHATVLTISTTTERLAESLARELLKDPQVKADLLHLVRTAFARTTGRLNAAHVSTRKKKKTTRARKAR